MREWFGCPHCNYFTTMKTTCVGWICQSCGKYNRTETALREKDMNKGSSKALRNPRKISPEFKVLRQGMEDKTTKWVGDVKAGKIPYTDPNTGRKVQ